MAIVPGSAGKLLILIRATFCRKSGQVKRQVDEVSEHLLEKLLNWRHSYVEGGVGSSQWSEDDEAVAEPG